MQELKIRTFDEIDEENVRWLWKPYIAFGKITVIQGDPGNGKTTLAIAIAALISRRKQMPTGNAPAFIGNVIYQSGEDNPRDTIKPRLVACGADCSKISFVEADGCLSPALLEEAIAGTNTKLVVLDPLQAFLTEKQDISSTKNMRPMLRDLGNVANRTGAAIIIIGHMNKVGNSKGIYRGLGSIDITAAARSVLLVGKNKSDPGSRFMTQIKNNLAASGKGIKFTIAGGSEVKFLGECDISEEDLLTTAVARRSKYEACREIILSMMAEGDRKSNDIYDVCLEAGISSSIMQTVKKKMKFKSVYKDSDWYWTSNQDSASGSFFEGEGFIEDGFEDFPENAAVDTDDADGEEIQAAFLDEPEPEILTEAYVPEPHSPISERITMQSPFGELVLVDWRACV
jgi:RecA/RadA recombinase